MPTKETTLDGSEHQGGDKKKPPRQEIEALALQERKRILEPGFAPTPSNEWVSTKDWWAKSTEDEKRDMLYGLCFYSAAKPRLIAKYFSIKEADLKPYQEQLNMGEAARILKINAHQLRWAMSSNIPNAKFFLGLQFAGQVQHPVHDDAPSHDEKKDNNINITVIRKDAVDEANGAAFDGIASSDQPLQ